MRYLQYIANAIRLLSNQFADFSNRYFITNVAHYFRFSSSSFTGYVQFRFQRLNKVTISQLSKFRLTYIS